MATKEEIIRIYEEDLQHPSYGYIAKKVGLSKGYIHKIIKQYKNKTINPSNLCNTSKESGNYAL